MKEERKKIYENKSICIFTNTTLFFLLNKNKRLLTVPLSKKYNQGYLCRTNPRTHPSCYRGVVQTGEYLRETHKHFHTIICHGVRQNTQCETTLHLLQDGML